MAIQNKSVGYLLASLARSLARSPPTYLPTYLFLSSYLTIPFSPFVSADVRALTAQLKGWWKDLQELAEGNESTIPYPTDLLEIIKECAETLEESARNVDEDELLEIFTYMNEELKPGVIAFLHRYRSQ